MQQQKKTVGQKQNRRNEIEQIVMDDVSTLILHSMESTNNVCPATNIDRFRLNEKRIPAKRSLLLWSI